MSEAANASLLGEAVFIREIGQVSKREHISRVFTAICLSALCQPNWLRAALYLGLAFTETSWCHGKIQVPDLPCGFLWDGPSESLFLWSQTLFFPEQRYHRLWQKGCCSPYWGSALHKHSRLGWSLTQMDGAGGRWHLPFHCLERPFSGLTLHSLTLVLCN